MEVQDLQPPFIFSNESRDFKTLIREVKIMTKVKCILGYYDTKLNRSVAIDEEIDVTDERAAQLIKAKVATPIAEKVVKQRKKKED